MVEWPASNLWEDTLVHDYLLGPFTVVPSTDPRPKNGSISTFCDVDKFIIFLFTQFWSPSTLFLLDWYLHFRKEHFVWNFLNRKGCKLWNQYSCSYSTLLYAYPWAIKRETFKLMSNNFQPFIVHQKEDELASELLLQQSSIKNLILIFNLRSNYWFRRPVVGRLVWRYCKTASKLFYQIIGFQGTILPNLFSS